MDRRAVICKLLVVTPQGNFSRRQAEELAYSHPRIANCHVWIPRDGQDHTGGEKKVPALLASSPCHVRRREERLYARWAASAQRVCVVEWKPPFFPSLQGSQEALGGRAHRVQPARRVLGSEVAEPLRRTVNGRLVEMPAPPKKKNRPALRWRPRFLREGPRFPFGSHRLTPGCAISANLWLTGVWPLRRVYHAAGDNGSGVYRETR